MEKTPKVLDVLKQAREKLEAAHREKYEPIALVGGGCRFPGGASNLESLWKVLRQGTDAVVEVPAQRWDVDEYYDPTPGQAGKIYTRTGGYLQDVDLFDAEFFGISAQAAAGMDPQHRLLLEVAWEALENAGQAPSRLRCTRTGVYVGLGTDDYSHHNLAAGQCSGDGTSRAIGVGRLSHVLGLQGPNIQLDTACSSSLVAVHLACQGLRAQECDLALVGGVNLILSPLNPMQRCRARLLSPDGRCKTFDATADGFGQGEGCGVVVLKRLSDAREQGDRVLALIRGSAVNHDGPSAGLTVPNGGAQVRLMEEALARSRVKASEVGYVEAHGSGTPLGDSIEMESLAKVYAQGRDEALLVGSVKTNFGNLEAAGGMASLLKVALCLSHREIPANLHFQDPNPHIPWQALAVKVPTQTHPWSECETPRIAAVSAFGASGTNAHLLMQEAEPQPPAGTDDQARLFVLSAKSTTALEQLKNRCAKLLSREPDLSLADICFTASQGREHHRFRMALLAADTKQLSQRLSRQDGGSGWSWKGEAERPSLALIFRGVGADEGSVLSWRTQYGPFRRAVARCEAHLPKVDWQGPLGIFVVEYAMAECWREWGVEPNALVGLGIGELAAACHAGALDLSNALDLLLEPTGGHTLLWSQPRLPVFLGRTGRRLETGELTEVPGPAKGSIPKHGCDTEFEVGPLSLELQGQLYVQGAELDWGAIYQEEQLRKVSLPTYPFERQSFWHESRPTESDWLRRLVTLEDLSEQEAQLLSRLLKRREQTPALTRPDYIAPTSAALWLMAQLWERTLEVERVGLTDNFFALGGHSLTASQLLLRLQEYFDFHIPLATVFENPTLESLVEELARLDGDRENLDKVAEVWLQVESLSDDEVRQSVQELKKG